MKRFLFLAPVLSLLSACTGTEEPSAAVRYVALSGAANAAQLRAVDLGSSLSALPAVTVPGALDLSGYSSGQKLAVLYKDRLEQRNVTLQSVGTFPNPSNFSPCYVRLISSVAHDRLAALSDCSQGGTQDIVVWRADGSFDFRVTLPPPTPSSSDLTRYAVQGDVVWAAHPATMQGSSELFRAVRNADGTVTLSTPVTLANVYDLSFYHNQLYAATDKGVQPLDGSGALGAVSQPLLNQRADRLFSDDRLLIAWRNSGNAEPLYVWNSKVASAGNVSSLSALSVAPDGTFATLQGGRLVIYDSITGLERGNWKEQTALTISGSAVTWLIP